MRVTPKIKLIIPINFIFFFLISNKISAYVNPGSGAMIIGSVWPLIVAFFSALGALLIKIFWRPIKNKFLDITKAKDRKRGGGRK